MSRFFIDRPVFAWVLAIAISLLGALAVMRMPVEQYPSVASPKVNIAATYPGASAKTLEDSVVQVIEQKMTGLDHLRYIESSASASGAATVALTFEGGTDPDIAQVQVQNKLQSAMSLLPEQVQSQGVKVTKSTGSMLMIVAAVSEDGRYTTGDLGDFLVGTLQDPISRVDGVGEVNVFGSQYAMRIWLDPYKLIQYGLTASEVVAAIRAQNVQVSAGSLGSLPAVEGQLIDAPLIVSGRFETVAEFEAVKLRTTANGAQVLLRDVARVEMGSESYGMSARYNGQSASGMRISAAAGANALDTVAAVKSKLTELADTLPPGVRIEFPVDSTPFVRHSIREVVKTLIEAVMLVFLVMYLFLGNLRATLIPTIAVPVVVLGTFGVLHVFGYSINTLTLFGMVLSIGLMVDDAIVVVENVERVMEEEGLSPRDACRASMGQISGALVGIGLVLCAAFLPMAFFGSSTGIIYRQFAVTVSTAVALSVLVALVLTPALCATMLRPRKPDVERRGFFGWFNRGFNRLADRYAISVEGALRRKFILLVAYAGVVAGVGYMYVQLPTGFLPDEDTGQVYVMGQLPGGATAEQTSAVMTSVDAEIRAEVADAVNGAMAVTGFSFSGAGQNQGAMFINLKDWSERTEPEQSAAGVQGRIAALIAKRRDASLFAITPPAVRELGNNSGFDMRLVDRTGLGHATLTEAENKLLGLAAQSPVLMGVRPNHLTDKAQLKLDIDLAAAGALGVTAEAINAELSNAFGSAYVNDFIDKGRVKKVFAQADAAFRMTPDDLDLWRVRNTAGGMTPMSTFVDARWEVGPPMLTRFNGQASLSLAGQPAPGYSSGDAMAEMTRLAAELPAGIGVEWAGLSYEEQLSGSNSAALYIIALLLVFLCLAALYESWAIPLSVLMDIPLGALGVLVATSLRGMSNDIYFQIGLITIVGLSAKNAILVVEFAKERFDAGASLIDATRHAVRQRLRPILMTSIAFGLGVLPLALSTGPGAASQNAVGSGVLGGAITTTLLGLFFVPLYFVTILGLFRVKRRVVPGVGAAELEQQRPMTPEQGGASHA